MWLRAVTSGLHALARRARLEARLPRAPILPSLYLRQLRQQRGARRRGLCLRSSSLEADGGAVQPDAPARLLVPQPPAQLGHRLRVREAVQQLGELRARPECTRRWLALRRAISASSWLMRAARIRR